MRIKHFITMSLCIFCTTVFAKLPDNYQSLSANEKQAHLWQETLSTEWDELPALDKNGWGYILRAIRTMRTLNLTFDTPEDVLPKRRTKFIHAHGSTAKVTFVPAETDIPFTGMYSTGGTGIARLSLAANPEPGYVPGMALKFLVDGEPSLNVVSIFSLDGQGDNTNFFHNNFYTAIDHPTSPVLLALEKIFEKERSPANDLPVNHLATKHSDGTSVDAPLSPDSLIFKPSDHFKETFLAYTDLDFRLGLNKMSEFAGSNMYDVYGLYEDQEHLLGWIRLDSDIIASQNGDEVLFFQHKR